MKKPRRRKCRHCGEWFDPDPRNLRHQRYCSGAACRQASKAASQRRWLWKPENRDYFRGPLNVQRVQAWRKDHPGYGRGKGSKGDSPLQEDCRGQPIEMARDSGGLGGSPLQDLMVAQEVVLVGLIANLAGSTLQEDIVKTSRQLLRLGTDILSG